MLKKIIKFTDFDGNEREETHYFNLTKAELIMWLTTSGDYTLDKMIAKLYAEKNTKELVKIFYDLIYMSYGEKSLDGRRFDKSDEVKRNFIETEAFSNLFSEIIGDANKAIEFITGIIPKEIADDISETTLSALEGVDDATKNKVIAAIKQS